MSRYVRTKDGVMTVKHFILLNLKEYLGPNALIWKDKGKYCYTREIKVKAKDGLIEPRTETRRLTEEEALKMVEETPNRKADTIEELCDEFVLIHTECDNSKDIFEATDNGKWLQHRGDSYYSFGLKQIRSGELEIKSPLYGAIWTDKGLIYVAKMNEEGELELL